MRIYNKKKNVYDAVNATLDYMKRKNIKKKIGLMILDNEANYEYSLEFMHYNITMHC
jgi:hypothetical protein